jgi:hypothetical protein
VEVKAYMHFDIPGTPGAIAGESTFELLLLPRTTDDA